ncbi:GGDEF domain-containing protein [Phytopseudomonas dryadis]|uniref:diguanylate cyclase n=1 Tax=Phytopseudomonas dryadis TaxID=2487520 RepID=A0ABY1Z5V6_9GAMM|nr:MULTISPECIES: GGDEF domain-containing protein [Pseudomonas]TBV05475.1 GGDEF domain-containing protein [Pseudomonas dryadis]TBV18484.1 GGDEF domain-containing protein [Pseudomonas sp. FRB 230]
MTKHLHRLLARLRKNFQLSIITLMGLFGVLGISPYAVYRAMQGNYLVSIADTLIVLSTIAAVLYAWRTDDTVKPGLYLAGVFSVGATLITLSLGVNGLFWIYPLILFNFFMVSPGRALLATILVVAALASYATLLPGTVFESRYQMLSFLVTALLASVLSFIFAYRTQHQREQLQAWATRDPLTGARNRRVMNEELKIAVASQRRHRASSAVLLMDLDHFKQINDRFGHQAGDQVLVNFVELLGQHSREEDRLFRFGGEEFLLLLPNTDMNGLRSAARHLQTQIAERLTSPGGAVTVSMGGAVLLSGEQWESWLQRADRQLYQAKSAGRNRTLIDETQHIPALV